MDYKALAKSILADLGGEENIISFTHCATRLRLNLKDYNKVNKTHLENTKGVMGAIKKGGQFQVVIGSDVPNVYRELNMLGNFEGAKQESENDDRSRLSKILDTVAGIFTPIIPAITGAGILKAFMSLLVVFGWIDKTSETYAILNIFSDAAFYFLPFLIAYSAARKFNCSPVMAMSVAGILLHPNLVSMIGTAKETGSIIRFIGLPVTPATYSSSVIPIILSVWLMSYIEPLADKVSPKPVKFFTKPLITLILTGTATIVVLGPLGTIIGDGIAYVISLLDNYASWLVPLIIGGVSPLLVISGTHYGLIPIGINNIATAGFDTIVGPGMLGSNIAQGGAAFAVGLRTRNKTIKQEAYSSGITAVCGITEPALYGVNLKFKKPLIAVIIGGALSGLYLGIMGVGRYTTGSPGLLALPGYIGGDSFYNLFHASIGCVIAFVTSFAATLIIGFEDEAEAAEEKTEEVLLAPVSGRIIPLEEVKDETFSQKILGDGIAIEPERAGRIVAPADGMVDNILGHAAGIRTNGGAEILIHVGIDTVALGGAHFKTLVKRGQMVKAGDALIEFDMDAIKKEGYELTTPIIITNSGDYTVKVLKNGIVIEAQRLIELNRRQK